MTMKTGDNTKTRSLYGIQTDESSNVSTDMFIGGIQRNQNAKAWQITLTLNNQRLKFKIDTGAQCNVIAKHKYSQLSKVPLQKSTANLMAFGGHKLATCGKAIISCQHNGKQYHIKFEGLDQDVPSVLGLPTSIKLNLIKHINTVQEQNTQNSNTTYFFKKYKDVFDGLGCINDVLYHINIDPSCQPVIHPPCHVPIKL